MAAVNFSGLPEAQLKKLIDLCVTRDWTLGFAESCTGGLLSAWLVHFPSVSQIFQGSVVCYSAEVKESLLDVPQSLMLTHGQVSQPVAAAMARGAKARLAVSWAVSITGIAGPSGGSEEKPVGTVCFGVSGPGFETSHTQNFDSKLSRAEIQRQAAIFALDFLLDAMK